jgi:hypothetical protein
LVVDGAALLCQLAHHREDGGADMGSLLSTVAIETLIRRGKSSQLFFDLMNLLQPLLGDPKRIQVAELSLEP